MVIRNRRYPDLGSNYLGRCYTCGSDCPDGQCPRQCNENGPVLTVDGKPMLAAWVALSHELGSTTWFSSDASMHSAIDYWTGYFQQQPERVVALTHLQDKMKEYGIA